MVEVALVEIPTVPNPTTSNIVEAVETNSFLNSLS